MDQEFLPCVSTALIQKREVVDLFCYGYADKELGIELHEEHLFRMFSSTKLVTACAMMLLHEEGLIDWEDPLEMYIPQMAHRTVLKPGAQNMEDVEPAQSSITLRHLMTHTSGLSYGIFDPGTLMYQIYQQARVLHPNQDLAQMMDKLATLPLSFHPGTQWEYSVASDVLGRVVEIVSGQSFGEFLKQRIFNPLGMIDTDFWVPAEKQPRLCNLYVGVDLLDPRKPGLHHIKDKPYPGAYTQQPVWESGGGGLVSTLGDTIKLIQSLLPGGATLLKPSSLSQMYANHLPEGMCVQFPNLPLFANKGFGLGSSVTIAQSPTEPQEAISEVGWGGLAGTIWWINPRCGIAGILMTQRYFGFGNPYSFVFKNHAYQALGLA